MFLQNFGEAFRYQLLGNMTKNIYIVAQVYSLYIDYIYIMYIFELFVCAYFRTSYTIMLEVSQYDSWFLSPTLRFAAFKTSQGLRIRVEQRSTEVDFPTTHVFFQGATPAPPPKKNDQHFSVDMLVFQVVHLFILAFMKDIAISNVKMRWRLQKEYM